VRTDDLWAAVTTAAAKAGWVVGVVDVARLDAVGARVTGVLAASGFTDDDIASLGEEAVIDWRDKLQGSRSVVVGAVPRPLTLATLTIGGTEHTVPVPPHYAGYETTPDGLTAAVSTALAPSGRHAVRVEPPLKTLAAGAGLARYGRNNITYVPGLGSYLQLAACLTDLQAPADAAWGESQQLDRCERCSLCLRACPTGAIRSDRFLLQTDRCLTWVNEARAPFPDWVDPAWHTCAVGCLRCQQVCPENAAVDLVVSPAEVLDEEESAAVLAARPQAELGEETVAKLRRSGLDYAPRLIARNLRVLIEG
jgi:epoxyqueuosine reductase